MINIREHFENTAHSDRQLLLMEASLQYLDKTQQLESLKKDCLIHSSTKEVGSNLSIN